MLTDRWRSAAIDVALAVLLTGVMVVASAESIDQASRPVDSWSVAAIAGVGLWSGLARRLPRTALVGATVSLVGVLGLGVPAFSPALALGVPMFAIARRGHARWGVALLAALAAGGPAYRTLAEGGEPLRQVLLGSGFDLSLLAVLLLLGATVRSRLALRAEAALRLRLAEQEHRRRTTEERIRTAQDLHDVLSHTLALVGIQASVAAENLRAHPERAEAAVAQVRQAAREAMSDVRSTIAVLRDEAGSGDGLAPAPGLAQLPDLVAAVRAAGPAASLILPGPGAAPLRPAVELAVYRVVQEALTNTLRHARADTVAVVVDQDQREVRLAVRDDGVGHPDPVAPAGSGLRGMAERVTALGGSLSFGGTPTGFAVEARLPVGPPR